MYKYNVKIQKVSGSLNESAMPSKNLVVKSKTEKSDKEVFAEASKFYKEKYGLVIESADVEMVDDSFKNQYFKSLSIINKMSKFIETGEYDGSTINALLHEMQTAILSLKRIPYGQDGKTIGDNYEKFIR